MNLSQVIAIFVNLVNQSYVDPTFFNEDRFWKTIESVMFNGKELVVILQSGKDGYSNSAGDVVWYADKVHITANDMYINFTDDHKKGQFDLEQISRDFENKGFSVDIV